MGNICCGEDKNSKAKAPALVPIENKELDHTSNVSSTGTCGGGGGGVWLDAQHQQQHDGTVLLSSSSSWAAGNHENITSQQPIMDLDHQNQDQQHAHHAINQERIEALRIEQNRLEQIVQTSGRAMVAVRSTRGSTGYYDQGFAAALAQHLEQTIQTQPPPVVVLPPPPRPTDAAVPAISTTTGATSLDAAISSSSSSWVYTCLSRPSPVWDDIDFGRHHTTIGGRSNSPSTGLTSSTGDGTNGGTNRNTGSSSNAAIVVGSSSSAGNHLQYIDQVAESFLENAIPNKERHFAGVYPMVENLL